jgi:hypothetical protein
VVDELDVLVVVVGGATMQVPTTLCLYSVEPCS